MPAVPITEIWKVHSFERVTSGGAPLTTSNLTIAAINSVSMPVNATVTKETTAEDVFAVSGRINFQSVDLQLTTTMAEHVFTMIPVSGICIDPTVGDIYYLYIAKYGCNGPATGFVHRRYKITKGLLYLNSVQCDHAGDLQVSLTLQAVYDGTNDSVQIEDAVDIPPDLQIINGTTIKSDRWTLGPAVNSKVNAATVGHKRSVNIDIGVTTSTEGADSDISDTFSAIDSVQPVMTVQGIDPKWFNTIGLGLFGKTVTHANTKLGFRKRDNSVASGFVSDATGEHIVVTAAGLAYYDQLFSSGATDAGTTSLRVECIDDATSNNALVFNVSQPMPT